MVCASLARLSGPGARLTSALTLPAPRPRPSAPRSSSAGSWPCTKTDMSSHTELARPGSADGSAEGDCGWSMCALPPKLRRFTAVAGVGRQDLLLILTLILNLQGG